MKKLLFLFTFLLTLTAVAQNPQTHTAPIFDVNAKYVNGVAPGYAPTPGRALNLNLGGGTVYCLTGLQIYSGGVVTLAANTINYVYLDPANSCIPTSNTTGLTSATQIPIAIVTTTTIITDINDVRSQFNAASIGAIGPAGPTGPQGPPGSGGNPASPAFSVQFANTSVSQFQGDSTFTFNPTAHVLGEATNISANSPVSDIRAQGAVIDGASDITAAFKAANIQACQTSGVVLLPCTGNKCALLNGASIADSTSHAACPIPNNFNVQWKVQGTLDLTNGTTLVVPNDVDFICDGYGSPGQFSMKGPSCNIIAPAMNGTLGTAITANLTTASTFTPTFLHGTIAQMPVNSVITVTDLITCNISSISRNSSNLVTFTATSSLVGAIAITSAGSGQTPGTYTITATGGGSPTETATASVVVGGGGTVTSVSILNNGNGYTSAPTFTVSAGGTPAVLTASLAASCRIPAGSRPTIAGVTDTTFNGTPMLLTSDYVAGTWTYSQANVSNSGVTSSSGGTMVGADEARMETTQITAQSGSTASALFVHNHLATTAIWGMAAVSPVVGTATPPVSSNSIHMFQGLTVTKNFGVGWWFGHNFNILLDGIHGEQGQPTPTSFALELASSATVHITHSGLTTFSAPAGGCLGGNGCPVQGYPYGLRITGRPNANTNGSGYIIVDGNTEIGSGIKIDLNGTLLGPTTSPAIGNVHFQDIVEEAPIQCEVMVDLTGITSGTPEQIYMDNVIAQDNFLGYSPCTIGYEIPAVSGKTSGASIGHLNAQNLKTLTNAYFNGALTVNGVDYSNGTLDLPTYLGNGFTVNDGITSETELRGEGAMNGPWVVPFATQAVLTNPTAWPSCVIIGGTGSPCSVITGLRDPWGGTNAGEIVSGSGGAASVTVRTLNTGTSAGDWIIYGAWCMGGANNTGACINSSNFGSIFVQDAAGGTDQFDNTTSGTAGTGQFQSQYKNDWWHPIVAANKITFGEASAHNITMKLISPTISGAGQVFACPFMIYIPVGSIFSYVAGSRTTGTFTIGETVTQTTSGATAKVTASTASSLTINLITGTPDSSDVWTGGSSGATYTPTATPLATMTTAQWDNEMARVRMQTYHSCVPASSAAGTLVSSVPLTPALLPVATTSTLGGVIPDGTSITVDGTGHIAASAGATNKNVVVFAYVSTITGGATRYFSPNSGGASAVIAPESVPWAVSTTLANLYCVVTNAPGGSLNQAFTVFTNGGSSPLACTINGSATTCNDTTHTTSLTAGQLLTLQVVSDASAATTSALCSAQTF